MEPITITELRKAREERDLFKQWAITKSSWDVITILRNPKEYSDQDFKYAEMYMERIYPKEQY